MNERSSDARPGARPARAWKERYHSRLHWLQQRMDQWWYLPCVALCAGLDIFLLCFPTDIFLVTSSALRPRRWVRTFMFVALGSALGMLAFAVVVRFGGPSLHSWVSWAIPSGADAGTAGSAAARYSALALFLVAVNPLVPPQPAIVVAVLAGMDPLVVFLWVYAGRLLKYGVYSFAAARAPRYVSRWIRPVTDVTAEVAIEIADKVASASEGDGTTRP